MSVCYPHTLLIIVTQEMAEGELFLSEMTILSDQTNLLSHEQGESMKAKDRKCSLFLRR